MYFPIPLYEEERLKTLRDYKILDTHPEEGFDELTRLAASICGASISLITLIDSGRQWFKSRVGLEISEMPRAQAFCAHAILEPGLLVIPDASLDKRFSTNPFVKGDSGYRFYAGAPLVAPNGYCLGTLCVIDRQPRDLDAHQREALRILGRQAMAQIELRNNLVELKKALSERDTIEAEREGVVIELQEALASVKTLSGLLPICSWCGKVRDDDGYWAKLESYIELHTDARLTHGVCKDCMERELKLLDVAGPVRVSDPDRPGIKPPETR